MDSRDSALKVSTKVLSQNPDQRRARLAFALTEEVGFNWSEAQVYELDAFIFTKVVRNLASDFRTKGQTQVPRKWSRLAKDKKNSLAAEAVTDYAVMYIRWSEEQGLLPNFICYINQRVFLRKIQEGDE